MVDVWSENSSVPIACCRSFVHEADSLLDPSMAHDERLEILTGKIPIDNRRVLNTVRGARECAHCHFKACTTADTRATKCTCMHSDEDLVCP